MAAEIAKLMPELRRIFPDIPTPLELPPEHTGVTVSEGVFSSTLNRARKQVV